MRNKLVFDGGFATQLVHNGHTIQSDPLWSARLLSTNQKAISEVHRAFLESGADAILSSTYQASVAGFQKHLDCSFSEAESLLRDGARLVVEARDAFWDKYVKDCTANDGDVCGRDCPIACASLGSYGAHLCDGSEYDGSFVDHIAQHDIVDFHRQCVSLMSSQPLDLYVFETIPARSEAEAIRLVIQEFPSCQFAITFSCSDGVHLSHGEPLSDVAALFDDCEHVVAVGVNCTAPRFVTPLVQSLHGSTRMSKNVLVKPNSGEAAELEWWDRMCGHGDLAGYVSEWVGVEVGWIGGCCGTTPHDITQVRERLYGP